MSHLAFTPMDDKLGGSIINKEKSHWVKWENKILKPIKLLGLKYDPKIDELKANTRTGNSLVPYTKKDAYIYITAINNRYDLNNHKDSKKATWEYIFKGRFADSLLSRLYLVNWNPDIMTRETRGSLRNGTINS